jgi:hypothetical protein
MPCSAAILPHLSAHGQPVSPRSPAAAAAAVPAGSASSTGWNTNPKIPRGLHASVSDWGQACTWRRIGTPKMGSVFRLTLLSSRTADGS